MIPTCVFNSITQKYFLTFSLHNSVFVSHSILIHVKVRNSFEINVSSMSQTPSHPFHTQPPRSYLAQTSHSIQNLSEKPFESSKKIIQTLTLFHYSKLHFSFIILSRLIFNCNQITIKDKLGNAYRDELLNIMRGKLEGKLGELVSDHG